MVKSIISMAIFQVANCKRLPGRVSWVAFTKDSVARILGDLSIFGQRLVPYFLGIFPEI